MALVGGYENELVEPPSELQWECSICLQVVREPCMVSCCSLRFCRSCIEHIEQQRNPCPHCQEKSFTILPDTQLKRLLMHKRVYCINKNAGCQWAGELRDAEKHVRVDCVWTEAACPNQCGQHFLRHMLNQHATEECPRRLRLCEFAAMGCDSRPLTLGKLQDHMQESVQKHLTLVCKRLEEKKHHEGLKIGELKAIVLARDMKIGELETTIQAQETNSSVRELEAATQVLEARVGELEAMVNAREARIAEMEATVQVREARVLEARVAARLAEVKELETRVQNHDARRRQLETSAQVHTERVKELESRAKAQKAKISELDAMVKTRDAKIKTLSGVIEAHKKKLVKAKSLLQERDNRIRILETVVDASEKKVGELEATVQTKEAAVDEVNTKLVAKDGRIQKLEAVVEARDARIRRLLETVQVRDKKEGELELELKAVKMFNYCLVNKPNSILRKMHMRDYLLRLALLVSIFVIIILSGIISKNGHTLLPQPN